MSIAKSKKIFFIPLFVLAFVGAMLFPTALRFLPHLFVPPYPPFEGGPPKEQMFRVQSIDTMKYSRDVAGQILDNPASFRGMIETEMRLIKEAGATHAAIATPYDERFVPVLRLWVDAARKEGLSVWFRGNFSGWEGWFEYPKISRETHMKLLSGFIRNNPGLFANGDIFSPCPECENGGPGDPRRTGDKEGYNEFLIEEYRIANREFKRIEKSVEIYTSMNGDIAREIITPAAARSLGGIILIDHYVKTPEQFGKDVRSIADNIDAKVGLGEFGGPIPDLNGDMTHARQRDFVGALFRQLYLQNETIPIVNYWTLRGGSTAIVDDRMIPKPAYFALQSYFTAPSVYGGIYNSLGEPQRDSRVYLSDKNGNPVYETFPKQNIYQIFLLTKDHTLVIEKEGYQTMFVTLEDEMAPQTSLLRNIYLDPISPSRWYTMRKMLYEWAEK